MPTDPHDGLALAGLGDLSAILDSAGAPEKFRDIALNFIREDGENPRRDFNPATLQELADTIRTRGVITPISVRPDPERPGGFIVNHGHRRLRASVLAGRATIPAVIDDTFRDEDRIIENIQRDNLGMFEVAEFISRKNREGMKQKHIAELIGKSAAYVSNHLQILDLPPATDKAVRDGRVTDVTTINELVKAEKQAPDAVGLFLSAAGGEVTRSAVKELRGRLAEGGAGQATANLPVSPASESRPSASANEEIMTAADRRAEALDRNAAVRRAAAEWRAATPQPVAPAGKDWPDASANMANMEVPGAGAAASGAAAAERDESGATSLAKEPIPDSDWHGGKIIVESADGKQGMLRLDIRPSDEKSVWVEWREGPPAKSEVRLVRLTLLAVVNGW